MYLIVFVVIKNYFKCFILRVKLSVIVTVATEMKITEQHFPVVLLKTRYFKILTFESMGEVLRCEKPI